VDAFNLRERVLDDYGAYVRSFLTIKDDRLRGFVERELAGSVLWPEPLLQLNPSYALGKT
jgi:hypothetical protein